MAQTLTDLFASDVADPAQKEPTEVWEWPENNAVYEELFVVKLPDCDDPPEFLQLPIDLQHLFSEIGTSQAMTRDLFPKEQVIEEPGLWKVKIKYTVDCWRDWETGHEECDFMLEVLEKQKI